MKPQDCLHAQRGDDGGAHPSNASHGSWRRWVLANSLVAGVFALLWLLLRSGTKPSRLTYPCQQAAFSAASLAFGVPIVVTMVAARHQLAQFLRGRGGIALAALIVFITAGIWGYRSYATAEEPPQREPPRGYRARVYHVTHCPQAPVGDHFTGLDRLVALMGQDGLKLYRSDTVSPLSGPDGIVAAGDTVIIKINYQWPERGGTNTDLLRGLIRRLVDHPDGFTGQVVVCENSQFNPIDGFDRSTNNAQDHTLSPHDVVVVFQSQGYNVCHYDWTTIRNTQVTEYSQGNTTDGYIVGSYDAQLQGRVSYPKFRTSSDTYISLKYGIWNVATSTYDRQHLKLINVPVLKSHHSTYGATVSVKHFMGVVTGNLSTNSHTSIARGILGAVMGEVQIPDLNIIDSVWINANPNSGPQTTYAGATRRDELVASRDPVAADIWSVKNILIPAFLANGYKPPWPSPSADPDIPTSAFRTYLDNSMNRILAAGYSVTNNLSLIDTLTTFTGDMNCDGVISSADIEPFVLALVEPAAYAGAYPQCMVANGDVNADGIIDGGDVQAFLGLLMP
jgi:hypothetical protein